MSNACSENRRGVRTYRRHIADSAIDDEPEIPRLAATAHPLTDDGVAEYAAGIHNDDVAGSGQIQGFVNQQIVPWRCLYR